MGQVLTTLPSGLVVASHGSDEAACAAALKDYDRDLILFPRRRDGQMVYAVYRHVGSERPLQFVCGWWDELGNPYGELSITGLLEMVKSLDRNTRSEYVDVDTRNAQLVERKRKDAEDELDAITDYYRDRLDDKKRQPLPRGRSLYLSRMRQRERIKTKEWRP